MTSCVVLLTPRGTAEISASLLEAMGESGYGAGIMAEGDRPAARPRPGSPRGAFWGRLLLAHLLCYPLLFAAAMASLSLAIIRYQDRLLEVAGAVEPSSVLQRWLGRELGLSVLDAARFEIVIRPVGLVLGVMFVLLHLGAVPWALAAARDARARGTSDAEAASKWLRRTQRWWVGSSLGLTALLVAAGLVGWVWIFTR